MLSLYVKQVDLELSKVKSWMDKNINQIKSVCLFPLFPIKCVVYDLQVYETEIRSHTLIIQKNTENTQHTHTKGKLIIPTN